MDEAQHEDLLHEIPSRMLILHLGIMEYQSSDS